ncbi:hypothetical protein GH741_05165 [Aquibacillus halophilus]|uniref:Uncharacterized protein n=1 Tax=Aquibacillus halophilus TaxID=930132 RepID=A0A6A8D8H9_9BACI|nr:hypothetical protein [Aquibacillus halophilus]MRH42063.1 hypothetical protein [Aquibacillus halophilus]
MGVLLVATLISIYEIPKMKKQNMKRDFILFSCVLFLASTIATLHVNGVTISNPISGLRAIFSPIGLGIENFFMEKGQ